MNVLGNKQIYRKRITPGNIVLTIIICSFSVFMLLSSTGCFSNNKQVENTAYRFASDVSMEDPNIFECEVKHGERSCYDKSLKMDSMGWFPEEGSGRDICVRKDGYVSIIYWNAAELKKVSEGKIRPNQIKGTSFGYDPHLGGEEAILMSHNGYFRTDTKWERRCFDTSKIIEGIQFEEIPILSKMQINEKDVKKYLDLIERVRLKYLLE
jgi:hypothetical protein